MVVDYTYGWEYLPAEAERDSNARHSASPTHTHSLRRKVHGGDTGVRSDDRRETARGGVPVADPVRAWLCVARAVEDMCYSADVHFPR